MTPETISLLVALLPIAEKLVVGGIEIFTRKDMSPEDLVAALQKIKSEFPEMGQKA